MGKLLTSRAEQNNSMVAANNSSLLAKCILCSELPAQRELWGQWREMSAFDSLTADEYRMLPTAYRTIHDEITTTADKNFLKGMYTKNILQNKQLFSFTQRLVGEFAECGAKSVLLKGLSLIDGYYIDRGVRSMRDIDILIPASQARVVANHLLNTGWVYEEPGWSLEEGLILRHSGAFRDPSNRVSLDLHWHVFSSLPSVTSDARYCRNLTASRTIHGAYVADAQMLFLHCCCNGMQHCFSQRRRNLPEERAWVLDACVIAKQQQWEFDWESLAKLARSICATQLFASAIGVLVAEFRAPIPLDSRLLIQNTAVCYTERIDTYLQSSDKSPRISGVPYRIADVLRILTSQPWGGKYRGVHAYVKWWFGERPFTQISLKLFQLSSRPLRSLGKSLSDIFKAKKSNK